MLNVSIFASKSYTAIKSITIHLIDRVCFVNCVKCEEKIIQYIYINMSEINFLKLTEKRHVE